MNDGNVVSQIPGELLNGPDTQSVIIRLPDGGRAEVTYVKVRSKKGKTTRWFCTPNSARIME